MVRASSIRRLLRMPGVDRRLLAEAGWRLLCASAAVRWLPFRLAVKSGSGPLRRPAAQVDAERLAWAVRAMARRVPFRAVCFEQALALQEMLRRRGMNAHLHYGVRDERDGILHAHVWTSLDDAILIGGEEAHRFQQMVVLP